MEKTKLGIILNKISEKDVSLTRTTLESRIDVLVEDSKRRPYKIQTGSKFFNHMLTGIASRACLNFDISYQSTSTETLDHVVVEDTGLTLGRAIRELLDTRQSRGV